MKARKQKLSRLVILRRNNSGIILLVVLWTLVILSVLAMTLGRGANIELTLTKHAVARTQAKSLAYSGVMFAIEHLRLDSENDDWSGEDSFYRCGVALENTSSAQEIFDRHQMGDDGYFSVSFDQPNDVTGETQTIYGLADEERRVNLNALNPRSVNVLIELITYFEHEENVAKRIAHSVVDWVDADSVINDEAYGAEDEYYVELENPYRVKNAPFDSIQEVLLVRGMTEDVFEDIKDYITIFPTSGSFKVNFDTAAKPVLTALARSMGGAATNTEESDADALVEKMMQWRSGSDSIWGTSDDELIDANAIGLNSKERSVFLSINNYRTKKSNYFRIHVKGVIENRSVQSHIVAVIAREDLSVVSWRRF